MQFENVLRDQRLSANLSTKDAAKLLYISERGYVDREQGRTEMNAIERFGLLVALGMDRHKAMHHATFSEPISLADGAASMAEVMRQDADDPFVRETDDAFVFVPRDYDMPEYEVDKGEVKKAEDILGWVDHMCEKVWVSKRHIELFVLLSTDYLQLKIHSGN